MSTRTRPRAQVGPVLLALPALLVLGIVLHMIWGVPPWILPLYLALSLVTFVVYALDKRAAGRAGARIPESTLHQLELLGGWPGALIAQQLLRHKTRKPSYQRTFWLVVALNALAFVAISWLGR